MRNKSWKAATVAGIISLSIGVLATYLISIMIPTTELTWSITAVGFASFFGGFSSHISGQYHQRE